MKSLISLILVMIIGLTAAVALTGCQPLVESMDDNQANTTVIELNDNNYWKYIDVNYDSTKVSAGEKSSISYEINGVLDFALYEDVVFFFDVIFYTDGQAEEEYQSYTMRIACNAAGDAAFETTNLGITDVTVGKWLGIDGKLVSLENYNWKIHFKSISGKVIYTV